MPARIFADITRIPYSVRWAEGSTVLEGSYDPIKHELKWLNPEAAVTLEQLAAVRDWCVELRFLTLSGVHG